MTIRVGDAEVVIRQRYAVASIANDLLVAVWFLVGSVMFFSAEWQTAGTWCFVFGSVELLIRPVIRLTRQVHLQRMHGGKYAAEETSQDF
ncbi:hypothetical protein DB35_08610 [Streptomyces abyssalis]|uniref:YrhK domain-containing protein n=1 Tax=Streptomyces abyssalis TaxID=933944 RepID=A0A1E7JS61_9ACTN|nr:YrhK family protein [Streptomyces abyssalis]OEU91719.1 hypothetical protein AN215_04200 [Streptomyces abyssalis]OEU94144.1 hypothetical protein DB35_08610 [Streptomyces abyssalis]OEV06571.1 hypothetical protein AN219_34185 [Streptomyces nanshensis]